MHPNLPSGTVTFLFTDIEGSTQLWEKHPDAMRTALARHDALLHTAIETNHGYVIKSTGDGLYAVFASATDGINAVAAGQRALQGEAWGETGPLRVRMALHTGQAELREGDYFGPALNRTARLMAVGAGGQCLLSQAAALVQEQLPAQVTLRDLGEHRLKDLVRPERIYQLIAPDLPSDFPPLKSLNTYRHNLPVQLTSLVGREQELAETRRLLGATRLLTLTGPGGTGKTRLALQLAAEVLADFADGVYVVFLAPIREPELVVSAVAQALGIQDVGGQPLRATILDFLRERQMLLVLDNFEQVLAAASIVGELLAACPRLAVLVTSREVLHLYGEQEYPTPPLALPELKRRGAPDAGYVSHMAQSPAVALFVQRAAAAKPGFTLTPANAAAVAEICVRVDGLPLALELAAAKLKLFPPQMLLARLQQRLALLKGGAQDLPARQRTLRDSIAWSYDLLAADEQAFFRRLSVFVGGFSLEAAQAVGASDDLGMDFLDALAGLVDKSLVRTLEAGSGEARFWMLETIHEYGLEQLQVCGEAADIQRRHAEYFRDLAAVAARDLHAFGPEQGIRLDRLEAEFGNLRAALAWSKADASRTELGLCLAGELFGLWENRGPIDEGRAWLAEFLTLPQSSHYPAARAAALTAAGRLATKQGDVTAAHDLLEEAVVLRRKAEDQFGLARALWALGQLEMLENLYTRAAALLEESLALARSIGSQIDIAAALAVLGDIALYQFEYATARVLHAESLALFRQLGSLSGVAYCLNALGRVAQLQQDYPQAQSLHEQSLALARQMGAKPMIARVSIELGRDALAQGQVDRAQALYTGSLMLLRIIGDKEDVAYSLVGLAGVAGQSGQWEQTARLLGAAEQAIHSTGAPMNPFLRADYEQTVAAARAQLGDDAFDAAWTAGQAMTLDQAIEYALAT